jgi:proline racemase
MFGQARHVLHVWDYHHGQATRIVVGGCPPLLGETMAEKQAYLSERYDHLRALICREPRGHRNMLGAFLTEPATPGCDVGVIFVHPDGYFEACGDSTFSVAVALVESGIVPRTVEDGEQLLRLDTVLGPVPVTVELAGGRVRSVTMRSAWSHPLGRAALEVEGLGSVPLELGWGGLLYAFVPATAVGVRLGPEVDPAERDQVLEIGTRLWQAARQQVRADVPGVRPGRPVDLITLYEDLDEQGRPMLPGEGQPAGARVVNVYAPRTMGRTPSGTGTAARLALLVQAGRLSLGAPFFHKSLLGLRFTARAVVASTEGVVSEISAMSYCMGTATLVLRDDDPFREGFAI